MVALPPHLSTTLLKACLYQFLLPSTSCLAIKKKITRRTKRQKTQFEETKQAQEPNMAGMLELSDQEFKTTMINMLRAPMDKVDSTQD